MRLWSGLILFAFVTCHFLNHAFGFRSVEAMDAAEVVLLDPWQTLPGSLLLLGAILTHAALGLRALYRRRTLKMPANEAVQLLLGLLIPVLMIGHVLAAILPEAVYGIRVDYERVVYQLWVGSPFFNLPRQFLLLFVVWIHGCIGLRAWLRTKPWYAHYVPVLLTLATLVPVLAVLGFIAAGLDMRDRVAAGLIPLPVNVQEMPGTERAAKTAGITVIADNLMLAWAVLVAGVFVLRLFRNWSGARFKALRVTYPDGRTVMVPVGFTVLEASRLGGVPHASVCGGRGRCSTCRVEIVSGGEDLPPPRDDELRLLTRLGAPSNVRLACQIRPQGDISVVPMVNSAALAQPLTQAIGVLDGRRRETTVAALFVDLRQSTRLADDRLPYDALFIVERYVTAVTVGVRRSGGHVINVAGDGVMSVFGVSGSARKAAQEAFAGALAVWQEIEALSADLSDELSAPLRFGMGLHVGLAVVGLGWNGGMENAPFLGDTGNVASRLETASKKLVCTLVASREAVELLQGNGDRITFQEVDLAGKQEAAAVAAFKEIEALRRFLAVPATA